MNRNSGSWGPPLSKVDLSLKTLFTGYLVTIGLGLLMSFAQILFTHGMADGEFGLSVKDIVYSYYGNREGSKLEAKLQGSMKLFASEEVRADLVAWARAGSPKERWETEIAPKINENCVRCHSVVPGIPDYTTYEGMTSVTQIDEGATVPTLARVSHIHLFGIAFIFFFVCAIFSLSTGINPWLKVLAIAAPYCFLVLDVFSWWATKYIPQAAYLTMIGGFGYSFASAFMILTSLWQIWFKNEDAVT
jgi:hypothetical protein